MMVAKRRGYIRISANVPEVIVRRWEEMLVKEYGALPFDMRGRVELAILEHTRLLERRLADDYPGSGGQGGTSEQQRRVREDEREEEGGPDQWHREESFEAPAEWQGYLKTG